ncbi:MAG: hypothetical protein HY731_04340 [Candidatus Tectomicrobia bacterium]|nr:hypothetical protein [Candidatus Tectomicrobia bacterium]
MIDETNEQEKKEKINPEWGVPEEVKEEIEDYFGPFIGPHSGPHWPLSWLDRVKIPLKKRWEFGTF